MAIILCILMLCSAAIAADSRLVTIGILSQPASDNMKLQYYHPSENWTYVAGSYVDWVGSSGAVPVLVPFDIETSELDHFLENLDGFLFPGGGAELRRKDDTAKPTQYQLVSEYIVNWIMKRNDKGHYFPLFATCLGFENLIIQFAQNTLALECDLDDEGVAHSLQVLPAFSKSEFWNSVGLSLASTAFKSNSIYFTHTCGIRTTSFNKNLNLTSQFELLTTAANKNGTEFVASMEHKKYPIVANQWHPEKNMFERGKIYDFVDRSNTLLEMTQAMISKFVQKIRVKGKPRQYSDIDPRLRKYFSSNLVSETLPLSYYERIFTFQRFSKAD
jgi:gamma-glutamyl hydrolase